MATWAAARQAGMSWAKTCAATGRTGLGGRRIEPASGWNRAATGITGLGGRRIEPAWGWNRAATGTTGLGGRRIEPAWGSNHAATGTTGVGRRRSEGILYFNRTVTGAVAVRYRGSTTGSLARALTGTAVARCLIARCLIARCLIARCLIARCEIASCLTGLVLTLDRTPTETMGGARRRTGTGSGPSVAAWRLGERAEIWVIATITWTGSNARTRRNAIAGRGVRRCLPRKLGKDMAPPDPAAVASTSLTSQPATAGRTDSVPVWSATASASKGRTPLKTRRQRVHSP
jgi:hypothetical protein